ncbi:MAG: ATP-binding cassette domain-containing protein [Myxococcota bacterium]
MQGTLLLERVAFAYGSSRPLFEHLNAHLNRGWTGVVGANGAGKTTLLRLLAGELEPTEGAIRMHPEDALIAVCPQHVGALEEPVTDFAWRWDADAMKLKNILGLSFEDVERWAMLSPGERKRWQVGAALARRPDVLLVDEPTNHLDAEARELVVDALATYSGVGVLVAHDRAVLDRLTTHTLWFERGSVRVWSESYSGALEAWGTEQAGLRKAYAKLAERRGRAASAWREQQNRRHGAERSYSRRMRDAGHKDHDARSMVTKGRGQSAIATHSRRQGVMGREVARLDEELRAARLPKDLGRSITIEEAWCPKPRVCAMELDVLQVGGRALLREVKIAVGRTDRVHVRGANGVGKTTLLRAILEHMLVPPERVLCIPQELTSADEVHLRHELDGRTGEELGSVYGIAAALGAAPDILRASESWSPGELRKMTIAAGLGRGAWAVVLDEPTNHLDLPSIERLEAALRAYQGAVIMVSHDAAFAASLTDVCWTLEEQRITVRRVQRAAPLTA